MRTAKPLAGSKRVQVGVQALNERLKNPMPLSDLEANPPFCIGK